MKRFWNACIMCQSMFCSIPCPWKTWDEKARPLMLLFLPFVGLEIGVLWAALAWLVTYLGLTQLLAGAVICLFPFFATGFMHLDGFMDVTDAVKSWRDLERRREILKDSRVGAFAVINCICLMIMQFACCASAAGEIGSVFTLFQDGSGILTESGLLCLLFIPVVSRCCAGLAVTGLPAMETSQYAGSMKCQKPHLLVYAVIAASVIVLSFTVCGKYGAAVIGCAAGYGLGLWRAYSSLKGMNGDISGYALTIGELCGLIVWALI